MPIFASFSKRAQLAIKLARDAAAAQKQPFVGTMHLLLGLLQAGGNYPACLTDRVTTELVQQQIENMPHEVENVPNNPGKIALTPHVRQVFQRAAQLTPMQGSFNSSPMGGGATMRTLGFLPPQQSTLMHLRTSRSMPRPIQAAFMPRRSLVSLVPSIMIRRSMNSWLFSRA